MKKTLFLSVLVILSLGKKEILIPNKDELIDNLFYILSPEGFVDLIEPTFSLYGIDLSISYNYTDFNEQFLIRSAGKAFHE